ncbi:MAG: helix-turn-helix domain-containing protein [Aureispira sp.]|nr:helix-turn-helix domain-containing protein [Aureispira sp.]
MSKKEFKYYEIVRIKTTTQDRNLDPHRHLYYELFFFFAGTGSHIIDFEEFDIQPPSLQLVGPHQLHQVKHSKDSEGYVIKVQPLLITSNPFLKDYFNFIQYNQHFKAGVQISKQEQELLLYNFNFLRTYNNDNGDQAIFAILATLNFYISILKNYQTMKEGDEQHPDNEIFQQFLELVESSYLKEKGTDFYTQKMAVSLAQLNNIVRIRTGMTTKQFLLKRILLEAKRLVVHSTKSVKEIAYSLEFLEPAHFTNFFKKHTGKTPSKFRADF